jgi:hypothetical protein
MLITIGVPPWRLIHSLRLIEHWFLPRPIPWLHAKNLRGVTIGSTHGQRQRRAAAPSHFIERCGSLVPGAYEVGTVVAGFRDLTGATVIHVAVRVGWLIRKETW